MQKIDINKVTLNKGNLGSQSLIVKRQNSKYRPLRKTYCRAFTLIELLVVVLIIGILAMIALPHYQTAVEKARVINLLPRLKAIINTQEMYWLANGTYAQSLQSLEGHDVALTGNSENRNGVWYWEMPDGYWVAASHYGTVMIGTDKVELLVFLENATIPSPWKGHYNCCAKSGDSIARRVCKHFGSDESINGYCFVWGGWDTSGCVCGPISL